MFHNATKERTARATRQVNDPRRRSAAFLDVAEKVGPGVAAREKIAITEANVG
jgi:hypothetical protein